MGALVVLSATAPVAAATTAEPSVTFVESGIETDTTWTPAEGPYRIIQDIEIAPGAALTVAPGTRVELAEDITVTVSGSFRANGTAARPVAITRSAGAAAERRWGSLRYNGSEDSSLRLRHTVLQGGTTGVTVASREGTVELVDSTARDFTTAGLAVAGATATPQITVRESTFRDIGGHAIRASPGAGTTDRVSLTAGPDSIDAAAAHTLALQPGVGVSFDSISLTYSSDGSVASVGNGSIERIGLDRNRNGSIERSFGESVASVSSTDSRLEIALSDTVELPSDGQLIVEYDDAVNPTTRGIYPVGVQLRDGSIPQIAAGVEANFVVGGVTSPTELARGPEPTVVAVGEPPTVVYRRDADQPSTSVRRLVVLGSTFRGIDGAGVFVAADRVTRLYASRNRIAGVAGSGVAVRAETSESYFRSNEITAAGDGIRVSTDGTASVTANENRIRNARTGIRLRQLGAGSLADGDVTLRRNRLSDNRIHGVGIDTESLEVAVAATNNTVAGNGRDGIYVSGWRVQRAAIRDNEIVGNDDAGVAIRTDAAARGLAIHDNTIADSGGHGLEIRSDLIVHGGTLTDNRLANNAGAGLVVASPITHRANLSVADNVVAANTYGVVLRGVLGSTVRDNAIVFNTNRFAEPVSLPDVEPGTGSYVAEGAAGVILDQRATEIPLSELVSDPAIDEQLRAVTVDDGVVALLRTDGSASTRSVDASAITIRAASGEVPTGIGVPKTGSPNSSYRFTGNGLYGHERGLTVDVAPLVTTNTTALVLTDPIRTVHAEANYWGNPTGPYHASILPAGEGNAVVTAQGWVDFVPFRETPSGPEYRRPTAAIDAPTTAPPGADVRLSGDASRSAQGPIVRYHYRTDGTDRSVRERPTYTFEMPNRSAEAGLVVEDSLGIESDGTAVAIEPGTATPSPTSTATPATDTPTATTAATSASTPPPTDSEPTLLGSLGSIWGLIGGLCYLLALAFGVYGIALTITNRSPPVDGLRIQGLAGVGILTWVVAGTFGPGPLLTVGIAAAAGWVALTGAAYVVVTRGLLDDLVG
ncbi:right-handed parallel beta-helix repeat-containing protein [Halobellus sp. MBLA0160]|uniref:Right-handed parallel beta-helix repeat-containing protein n=1 Tax=Halobellus ruber TaxID=2761102 RepID=A0A7J9SKC0_9EURY|nr:right-handed parallel beta-helix repeat-containing protein [Halobellus ruber]